MWFYSLVDSKIVYINVELKGLSFCYFNGLVLFCGEKGIFYIDIEGKIILGLLCMKLILILYYYF